MTWPSDSFCPLTRHTRQKPERRARERMGLRLSDVGAHTAYQVAQQFGLADMQRILTEHATTPRD